jgi:hypothetical protein
VRFDCGWGDPFTHIPATARQFSDALAAHGVPHQLEECNGGHDDRLWGSEGRLAAAALPWMSRTLDHDTR